MADEDEGSEALIWENIRLGYIGCHVGEDGQAPPAMRPESPEWLS
jgi:hypothetical protein